MKVENLVNSRGNEVINQFIITQSGEQTFQSYETTVAKRSLINGKIILDIKALDYSPTTSKHLATFLGYENAKDLRTAIKNKEKDFTFKDLN